MNVERSAAIAYNILESVSTDARNMFFNAQNTTAKELAEYIVFEELEKWQYCYTEYYTDPLIPRYISQSFSQEELEEYIQTVVEQDKAQSHAVEAEDAQLIQAAENKEEYYKKYLDLYKQSCIMTFGPVLESTLPEGTLTDSELEEFAELIVETVGLWKWHILTRAARDQSEDANQLLAEWVLTSMENNIYQVIESEFGKELDYSKFIENIADFNDDKPIHINFDG